MPIFNSLGSNYNLNFALSCLLAQDKPEYSQSLKKTLEKKYGGECVLLYKGRQALYLALKVINFPANSKVAINGFTCYAVYEAITEAGFKCVYLDIEKDNLNFSKTELEEALKENNDIKAVVLQNTLGYPCDIEAVERICKKKNLVLIEDLAHSVGSKYLDGREAGTVGDFVILSFSQDKIVDGVSGGALISRNKKYSAHFQIFEPNSTKQIKAKFYPFLTYVIRVTYNIYLGKILHLILKTLNLLSDPMEDNRSIVRIPHWAACLILQKLESLSTDISRRREIANIYSKELRNNFQFGKVKNTIQSSANLRFPIKVGNRSEIISILKRNKIYLSDVWYDAPLAPRKFIGKTDYNGECNNSENISRSILNLPTHINVKRSDAKKISEIINKWAK